MTNDWQVVTNDDGTYSMFQPGREHPVLSCTTDQAVTFHIDLLDPDVISEYSFWMSRVVTLTQAAH